MNSKYESLETLVNESQKKIFFVVENIRSAYNVGAMFRTADGAGNIGLILVGYTPTPENPKVIKTGLGAENVVPWMTCASATDVLMFGKKNGILQVGLELTKDARNIFSWLPASYPVFIYVGNEVTGVSLEAMMALDMFIMLPMNGIKASLNVAEATSVAMYEMQRKLSSSLVN